MGRDHFDDGGCCREERTDVGVSGEPAGVPPQILDLDHVFEALAHPRRRYLVESFRADRDWTVPELATRIAARERERERGARGEWRPVYVSLCHSHVPKLAEEGVLRYDRESESVSPGPHAPEVLAALDGIALTIEVDREATTRCDTDD